MATPLLLGSGVGHEVVIQLLLARMLIQKPSITGHYFLASKNDYEEIVRLLEQNTFSLRLSPEEPSTKDRRMMTGFKTNVSNYLSNPILDASQMRYLEKSE